MKNKKGFTLFEFMLVLLIMLVVTTVSLPLILYAIKTARISAFKSSAQNVLDTVEYYLTNTDYMEIPKEGIDLNELNLELENNNFDSGLIQKNENDELEYVYISKNNYCAIGTKKDMKVTDLGCGALDSTAPEHVYLFLKEATDHSITVVATTDELDSKITSYEYSIDSKKYEKKTSNNEYTFSNLTSGNHTIKVRVKNEAGLENESVEYSFQTSPISNIYCTSNIDDIYKSHSEIICSYPENEKYNYQYSTDSINWIPISLENGTYKFSVSSNMTIYTRVIEDEKTIKLTTLNFDNIDSTLNGATPELLDNMIPVIYDEAKKVWIKANPKTRYFDYANKNWANAVLVRKNADTDDQNSHSRSFYLSDEAIGKAIYEKDIIGYYVWIPRYRYQLFNVSNKSQTISTISILFENKDTTKSSGKVDDNFTNGEYYTHPAFTINNIEYNGFWVSKFQNSVSEKSSCYLLKDATNCDDDTNNLYSLPLDSVTNVSISNAYLMSNNMTKGGNIYGLNNTISHVLTNLEWGAIAYLASSNYGINQEIKSVSSNYKENLVNSTTGNITGVFEMAGKLPEMVMANYNKDAGKNEQDNSGFKDYGKKEWPSIIDYYEGITIKHRILGDAIGEVEGWYPIVKNFVNGENPFMIRGGIMNGVSSIYHYSNTTGNHQENLTFRTALIHN